MLLTKTELEEMVRYNLEELGVELTWQRGSVELYDVGKEDLTELFERVIELSYKDGQNNILENTGY